MDFTDTPEQAALREVVCGFLRQHATPDRVRQAMADPAACDRAAWTRLTGELGLAGLAVPEAYEGAGATLAEVAVAVEEIGRVLLPVPYLSSALAAAVLAEASALSDAAAGGVAAAAEFLPGLASGSLIGAFALTGDAALDGGRLTGVARHVIDGASADVFLVRAGRALAAVRAADATVTPVGTLDATRSQATVEFAGSPAVRISPDADGGALASRATELLRTALAVESAGAASHCLSATVDYLKTRVQFGRPIGEFQALKHRCADLAAAVESARATARAAVWTGVHDPAELGIVGPLAKKHCADVFWQVAAEMIQLHGGIGFTWEHEAHLYLKRAKSTQLLCGSPGELRALVGRRAGLLG